LVSVTPVGQIRYSRARVASDGKVKLKFTLLPEAILVAEGVIVGVIVELDTAEINAEH